MSGLIFIVAGVAVFELWRRGYLANVVASASAAAKGQPGPASLYAKPTRPFMLPGADAQPQASLGGPY